MSNESARAAAATALNDKQMAQLLKKMLRPRIKR